MVAAAKSLLAYNRMDRVVFLTEDDRFPVFLPRVIDCINVSGQRFFDPHGPNFHRRWTYMTLMRLALPKILPEEERVLWLDCDTIVQKDLSQLFEMDMHGKTFAMVAEPRQSRSCGFTYHNAGVTLIDMKRMSHRVCHELITMANCVEMPLCDQDAINYKCKDDILTLPPVWNSCRYTEIVDDPAILHFAANPVYMNEPLFQEYAAREWRCL